MMVDRGCWKPGFVDILVGDPGFNFPLAICWTSEGNVMTGIVFKVVCSVVLLLLYTSLPLQVPEERS